MAVTAFFVTRNHDQTLGRAIQSVADLASEVVVADTGSIDRTQAVAAELGARFLSIDWQQEFGAACNEAVAAATHDWLLWLNPDEEIEPGSQDALLAAVAGPNAFARPIG